MIAGFLVSVFNCHSVRDSDVIFKDRPQSTSVFIGGCTLTVLDPEGRILLSTEYCGGGFIRHGDG